MAGYFEEKLIDLLPPVYREQDANGDLQAFLSVPAVTLDELKELIDRLPSIFDIDNCDVRFIPLLANIVGCNFDPTRDPNMQRREILEAIEFYRRKGSIPAIHRSLVNVGWAGKIDETFRSALRLNKRSHVSGAKLPGRIYSLGVYRVECDNLVSRLREALKSHHPAGMKTYFLQWLQTFESTDNFTTTLAKFVEMVMMGHLHETFVVRHNRLNSGYKLTYKEKTWGVCEISCHFTLLTDIERAGTRVLRWLRRTSGFKLNAGTLNSENLANLWISEGKAGFTCEVDTGSYRGPAHTVLKTCGQHLNRAGFNHAQLACHVIFKQKDFYAFVHTGFTRAANLYTVLQWPTD
ncbi:phage tail protein [bacterium]|nr:phage tail protein [bacterium]